MQRAIGLGGAPPSIDGGLVGFEEMRAAQRERGKIDRAVIRLQDGGCPFSSEEN
jgi:hypothetical protein